jgi:hypothetical protein
MHMVTKIQQRQTTGEEAVEVLVNEPFENEEWKGQFTSKIYHLQRYLLTTTPQSCQFIGELSNKLICERFQD